MTKLRLRTKMIIWLWGTSVLIFTALMFTQFVINKFYLEKEVKNNAINLARYYGKRLDAIFASAAIIPSSVATRMETDPSWENRDASKKYLERIVQINPFIYGAAIALESDGKAGNRNTFCPYYYYHQGKLEYKDLSKEDYKYWQRDWFSQPKASGNPVWTDAYFDKGGGDILMVTYAYPFYKKKQFAGIATVDISIDSIVRDIDKLKVLETGYGFMLNCKGDFLSFPDKSKIGRENITTLVPTLTEEMDSLSSLPSGNWIFTNDLDPLRKEPSWIVLRPIRQGRTMVGAVVFVYPEKEVLTPLISLQDKTFIISVTGLLIFLTIIIIVANSISRPIVNLSRVVEKVANGDLENRIEITGKNLEVTMLQNGFNKMLSDLKLFIKNLRETTAVKERIESELKIANQIQTSMLPRIFPPFPNRKEIDIFATMDPAKEVGGDFYDFFLIGENKLCFLVGDVSGKGVPAALFMMINKVLLKNEGMGGNSPDKILTRVNTIISDDNEELMFVTIFCAILDLATGEVEFANAGHNPPMIGSEESGFDLIRTDKNFVLGVKPNITFTLNKTTMKRGDTFFLYTDGVTEAMNPEANQFTETRLQHSLTAAKDKCAAGLIQSVKKDITEFVRGAEQSDDITMLAIKFLNKES